MSLARSVIERRFRRMEEDSPDVPAKAADEKKLPGRCDLGRDHSPPSQNIGVSSGGPSSRIQLRMAGKEIICSRRRNWARFCDVGAVHSVRPPGPTCQQSRKHSIACPPTSVPPESPEPDRHRSPPCIKQNLRQIFPTKRASTSLKIGRRPLRDKDPLTRRAIRPKYQFGGADWTAG